MDRTSPQTSKSTVLDQSKSEGSSSSEPALRNQIQGIPGISQDNSESHDLLHDQHADSDDEVWVMENLLRGLPLLPEEPAANKSKAGTNATQDGVLNVSAKLESKRSSAFGKPRFENVPHEERISCPCCFTTVSFQAQPHDRFEGQFRALFVSNCIVLRTSRVISYYAPPSGDHHDLPARSKYESCKKNTDLVDVACAQCGTLVGVLDEEGTYHFCNVMC